MNKFLQILDGLLPFIMFIVGIWLGSVDYDDRLKNTEVTAYSRGAADAICIVGNFDNCKEMSDKNAREFIEKVLELRK